jgi:hypothetical protein
MSLPGVVPNKARRIGALVRSSAMRDRLLYLILAANVLVVAGVAGKTAYDYWRFRTLNDEGRTATATVDHVELAVHNRLGTAGRWLVYYSFKPPTGVTVHADVGVTKEMAARFRVGQRIDVVYAPGDPSTTAFNPEQAWAVFVYDEWVLVPYLATMMVLIWNVLERRKTRRA